METLDTALSFSVFPPTPPPSTSSPSASSGSLWDADLWGASSATWLDEGWALDGLPDVKPDVSELLQASLRQDLPVLNADSTTFLLDGDAAPAPAAWLPQWSYCAYCAAGGGVGAAGCGASVSQPLPPQGPSQLYPDQGADQGADQGGGYLVDPYLGTLAGPMPAPFADGLVFVDSPALCPVLSTVPEDTCLEDAVHWANPVPPAPSPLPAELSGHRSALPLPEPPGKSSKRAPRTSRDPFI
ncbi:uncharacterized protein LOC117640960 isoform X2 [Thrips palmi]|uniref:Uncharacterized protein LOC117640960 isoform X2 n=1 Tax=Thrips palmi TaxID=161013 RepID=A0A6P8ZIN4_THRPL|nr:uncharacterized protein LOC117640960 isoform X2 [Thrips palmi]